MKTFFILLNKVVYTTILILLFASCNSNSSNNNNTNPTKDKKPKFTQKLNRKQALNIAKSWVAAQGYTTEKVDFKKTDLKFEKNEFASDTASILKLRHNTLVPNPVGIRKYDGNKWLIAFNTVVPENNIVRALTMDSVGVVVTMQSLPVRYDWVMGSDTIK